MLSIGINQLLNNLLILMTAWLIKGKLPEKVKKESKKIFYFDTFVNEKHDN